MDSFVGFTKLNERIGVGCLRSTMEWKRKENIPVEMNSHHIVRIGNNVYCGGG